MPIYRQMRNTDQQLEQLKNDLLNKNKRREMIEEWTSHVESLFVKMDEFPPTPPLWLVEGFLPQGYLCLLAGHPKSGKTALATAIALAVVEGKPFAGMNVVQSPVLWLSLEESRRERAAVLFPVVQAYAPAGAEKFACTDSGPDIPLYTCYGGITIDSDDGCEALDYWINKTQAKLVVVDPLHAAHSGRSLYDGWAARKTLRLLKRLCSDRNVTALVLHHLTTRGKQRAAESVQLSAIASIVMILSHTFDDQTDASEKSEPSGSTHHRLVTLECAGRGHFSNTSFHFRSHDPLHYEVSKPPKVKKKRNRARHLDNLILAALAGGKRLAASEIAEATGANVSSVRCALPRLLHLEKVKVVCISSGATIYALSSETTPLTKENSVHSGDTGDTGAVLTCPPNPPSTHRGATEPRPPTYIDPNSPPSAIMPRSEEARDRRRAGLQSYVKRRRRHLAHPFRHEAPEGGTGTPVEGAASGDRGAYPGKHGARGVQRGQHGAGRD